MQVVWRGTPSRTTSGIWEVLRQLWKEETFHKSMQIHIVKKKQRSVQTLDDDDDGEDLVVDYNPGK